jgi:hypothetical protein
LAFYAGGHYFNATVHFYPAGSVQSFPTATSSDSGLKLFYNANTLLWNCMTEYVAYGGGGWGGHSFFYVNNNATLCPNGPNRIMDLSQYIRCYKQMDMTNNNIANVSLITFSDSSYNNTKIDIGFAAAGTGSSQDFIQIACNGTRYGGLFGGGLTQSVGVFFYIKFY